MTKSYTYKDSGVDIEKAEASLNRLKKQIAATNTPQVLSGVGLFGGFYDISELGYKKPVLVSSTDGVGTKLKVAMLTGQHDSVGQDLVNHCINDIAVCGAHPLYFMDYFACGTLETGVYEAVVGGVAEACKNAGIPLLGGETAEMPDFYQPGDYDICGTISGIVEKDNIITGEGIAAGDVLVGIPSNGLHTNGYTLARNVLLDAFDVNTQLNEFGMTVGEEMLRIHRNYYPLIQSMRTSVSVKGISHVTGGGIVKNTSRLLTDNLSLDVNWGSWPVPAVFEVIEKTGNVPQEDMRQTFNMGVGLIVVVAEDQVDALLNLADGETFYPMGRVVQA
ncbi:MAG: phosphoribosylformylglycinamidine cyclo-ligase [Calditrichota bacterium]